MITNKAALPLIIQGGMGIGISHWRLAQAVSKLGQLGVVSGTALDQLFARRLQDGDPEGHMKRGLSKFPFPKMAERIWAAYFVPGGKSAGRPYLPPPSWRGPAQRLRQELCLAANFVEVALAREGHANPVGINYLEKIQMPHLPSIYGAMLAGVGCLLMGAGIPLKIPAVLDRLACHAEACYPLRVLGSSKAENPALKFVPKDFWEQPLPDLRRPHFLAIVASDTLAAALAKKCPDGIDGFVVEGPTAGGHNAPPRSQGLQFQNAEPVYGDRDQADLKKMRQLALPFWLAGGFGSPRGLQEALQAGASGVQVGTAFAFCEESGLRPDYKKAVLQLMADNPPVVLTDPVASPTGFPFKVVALEGTLSQKGIYGARPRICDLGYMQEAYWNNQGELDFRCAAESFGNYQAKGGQKEKAIGKKCLCNALLATAGHPQRQEKGFIEPGIITAGATLAGIRQFFSADAPSYSAKKVIARLLEGLAGHYCLNS